MTAVRFTVHGTPAPQGSKDQFGGEANPRTRPWRAAVAAEAARAMNGRPLLTGPVTVTAAFTFTRPKAHYRTGRHAGKLRPDAPSLRDNGPDLDKLCRAIGDSLTGTVLRDDRQIAYWVAVKLWGGRDRATVAVTPVIMPALEIPRLPSVALDQPPEHAPPLLGSTYCCAVCADSGHVCENHPGRPWAGITDRGNVCDCGGAGMPCPVCCDPIPEDGSTSIVAAFVPRHLASPPRPLSRPAVPTTDQLAIDEELETWDDWVRGLGTEGGQER